MIKERPILFSGAMVCALLEGRKTQTRRLSGLEDVNAYPGSLEGQGAMGALGYRGFLRSTYYLAKSHHADFKINKECYHWFAGQQEGEINPIPCRCPCGKPGDKLWVKETFRVVYGKGRNGYEEYGLLYAADGTTANYWPNYDLSRVEDIDNFAAKHANKKQLPSLFMPRWASRITLEITDIRAERVADISEADCVAEGILPNWTGSLDGFIPAKHGFLPHDYDAETGCSPFFDIYDTPTAQECYAHLWNSINGEKEGCSFKDNPWIWVVSFKRIESEAAK